jgi:hypothetical protein
MKGMPEGFMIQADNVTCEFNIPPADTYAGFNENIARALTYVREYVGKRGLKVSLSPTAVFPEDVLNDPRIRVLGCDSDLNAWTVEENPTPKNKDIPLRTTGGHVHVGWKGQLEDKINFVRAFDVYVTLPSILKTEPNTRRAYYGAAGACRIKPYGVECRSLDSFWLQRASWRSFIWKGIRRSFHAVYDEVELMGVFEQHSELICDAINLHDKELADFLVAQLH